MLKTITGGSSEAVAIDNNLIKTLINTPFDGSISPAFVCLFNRYAENLKGVVPNLFCNLLA